MPWTLYGRELDERINLRAIVLDLRRDEHVREARWLRDPDLGVRVDVEFHEGYDSTEDRLLAARCRAYRNLVEEPERPIPRSQGMTHNFIRLYGSDEQRRTLDQPNIDQETRSRIIEQFLADTSGREHLARSMIEPLRRRLDYQSVARRTFLVDEMPQGALPVYDREPNVAEHVFPAQDFHNVTWDTDYLSLPGHEPTHYTQHFTKPDELPGWVAVGSWVQEKSDGRIGMIVEVYKTEDRGRREHLHVKVGIWRTTDSVDYCAFGFLKLCEPCRQPYEPLTVWARILLPDQYD